MEEFYICKMKNVILYGIIILFCITTISAFDIELIQACGGDAELMIACPDGDAENIPYGGETIIVSDISSGFTGFVSKAMEAENRRWQIGILLLLLLVVLIVLYIIYRKSKKRKSLNTSYNQYY